MEGETREAGGRVLSLSRTTLEILKHTAEGCQAHLAGRQVWGFGWKGLTLGSRLRSPALWRMP